ncbi:hypothetical protein Dimus_013760, partial [Dionaea muscipula]
MAIGKRWGEVLRVEFGSLEGGTLDDGRIFIMTETLSLLFCFFTLMVKGLEFTYWVMEEFSASRTPMQDHTDLYETPGSMLMEVGAAMDGPERKHESPDFGELSPSEDGRRHHFREFSSDSGSRDGVLDDETEIGLDVSKEVEESRQGDVE